jgi:hypothetical protein
MNEWSPLDCLTEEWTCYLENHGHRVVRQSESSILLSRDRQGLRYRWLLRCEEADSVLLSGGDRKCIRRQNRLARHAGEKCFLVVKFGRRGGKAVIVPAAQAGTLRRLSANVGGIPWEY